MVIGERRIIMGDLAWVNGTITSLDEAKVPLMDYGYLFGYGVYEAFKVYNGKPFAVDEHLDRLERGLMEVNICPNNTRKELIEIIHTLITKSGYNDAAVYLHFTKGVGPRNNSYLKYKEPVFAAFIAYLPSLPENYRREGVSAISYPDQRWAKPYIKTLNLLPNILAKEHAESMGVYEAILVNDGTITEGASSNIFSVFEDIVITPPTDGKILAGVTRQIIIDLCKENNIEVKEEYMTLNKLKKADEIFITNAGIEILPVSFLDNIKIGKGEPGLYTNKLYELFMNKVSDCTKIK